MANSKAEFIFTSSKQNPLTSDSLNQNRFMLQQTFSKPKGRDSEGNLNSTQQIQTQGIPKT